MYIVSLVMPFLSICVYVVCWHRDCWVFVSHSCAYSRIIPNISYSWYINIYFLFTLFSLFFDKFTTPCRVVAAPEHCKRHVYFTIICSYIECILSHFMFCISFRFCFSISFSLFFAIIFATHDVHTPQNSCGFRCSSLFSSTFIFIRKHFNELSQSHGQLCFLFRF